MYTFNYGEHSLSQLPSIIYHLQFCANSLGSWLFFCWGFLFLSFTAADLILWYSEKNLFFS